MDDIFKPQQERRKVDLSSIAPEDLFHNSPAKKFFGTGGAFASNRAGNDLKRYRQQYPGLRDDLSKNENWKFYSGEMKSRPDGDFIDQIHVKWWGDYRKLEDHHGYIQWLFPIREDGMNYDSQALQLHELQRIKESPCCMKRLLKSYDLMLDFYGVFVADKETGELARGQNYKERYQNLRNYSHNNLRITRILKCLGEIGYEHYKRPFLDHFIDEIWETKWLFDCAGSCRDYWIGTLRVRSDRKAIKDKISRLSGLHFHESSGEEVDPLPEVQPITAVIVPSSAAEDDEESSSSEAGPKTQFGVIIMEDREASVEVPPVFGDSTNFTYLLTPVGKYADVYVKKPMKDNEFVIGVHGDFKGPLKVNWEIATTSCYNYDDFFAPEEDSSSDEGKESTGKSVVFGEILVEDTETEVEIPPNSFGKSVSKFVYHLTPIGGCWALGLPKSQPRFWKGHVSLTTTFLMPVQFGRFASLFVSSPLKHDRFTISRVEESAKPLKVHWEVHVATQ